MTTLITQGNTVTTQNALNFAATTETTAPAAAPQPTLKDKAVAKALEILRNMGAGYIVMDEAGIVHTHGSVYAKKVKPTERKRRALTYPYGSLTAFVKEKGLLNMAVGESMFIAPEDYDVKQVRGVCSSLTGRAWGSEAAMTTVTNGKVEILRLK
jgi:hypothetical protein